MAKIVIGVHGLGNKPPADIFKQWWINAIFEGFRRLGSERSSIKFELVYWAKYIHSQPLNPSVEDPENPLYLEEPYMPSTSSFLTPKKSNRKKFLDYLEKQMDKLMLNEDLTINFSAITDLIIHHYFRDLEIYYSKDEKAVGSQTNVSTAIKDDLKNTLLKYKNQEILLIAHSMGTIIAYEVLQELREQMTVNTFITMGSPLGVPVIMGKIHAGLAEHIPDFGKLSVPENIQNKWINFSDLEDKVAINYDLADDIVPNSRNIEIEDIEVHNDYAYKGKSNPHKLYGYLRTPEVSRAIMEFLQADRNRIQLWMEHILYWIQKMIKR